MIELLAQASPAEALGADQLIARVLLALALILLLARAVGAAVVRFGQPRVVGEMIAGILIGPTVLSGSLAQPAVPSEGISAVAGSGMLGDLFPLQVFSFLDLIGIVALVLFMFLLGLEVEHRLLRGRGRQIVLVSIALFALPVVAGFGLGAVLDSPTWKPATNLAGDPVSSTTHALFIGAALSVSASAALARILQEKRMMRTDLGAIGMGASTLVTFLMFLVLAAAVGSAEGEGVAGEVRDKVLLSAVLVATLVLVVRPLLAALLERRYRTDAPIDDGLLAILLLGALLSALAADRIGINALTGGFLFGAVVPQLEGLALAVTERLQTLLVIFFVPVFLAVSGLQTDLGVIRPELAGGILLFLALALLTKWAAAIPVGLATGLDWRQSNVLGILLNCRGLEILIVAVIGKQLGVVTDPMQAAFVIAAIATTVMTAPAVNLFLPSREVERERDRSIQESMMAIPRMTGGPRVLVVPTEPAEAAAVTKRAEEFLGSEPAAQFLVAHLPGLRERGYLVGHGAWDEARTVTRVLGWLGPIADSLTARGNDAETAAFQSPDPHADLARLAADWAATHAVVSEPALAELLESEGIEAAVAG